MHHSVWFSAEESEKTPFWWKCLIFEVRFLRFLRMETKFKERILLSIILLTNPKWYILPLPANKKCRIIFLQCAEWSRLWNLQHKSEILWSQQQIGTWKGPFIWFFSLTMQLQHIKQSYGLKFSHLMTVADPKAVSKIALVKEVLNTDRVNNMNPKYFIRLK